MLEIFQKTAPHEAIFGAPAFEIVCRTEQKKLYTGKIII